MTAESANAIEARPELTVELTHVPAINFAVEHAGVPVVTEVRVSNTGTAASNPLELETRLEPDLADKQTHAVGVVRPGEPIELPPLDLRLRPGRLRSVIEAERAELVWELRDANGAVASGRSTVEVLAHNEWPGLRAPPALLACFVTPNDRSVATVLRKVQERLRERTGDSSISGYQTRSTERVREMIRALYTTVQDFGIAYIGAPASYEDAGQKVRFLDTILRDRHGNCLDLTLLVASCLEQMGISPLIVIERSHAYPGAWLCDERFYEGVVYDVSRLRNTDALGQVVFFDSSAMVHEPRVPFEVAENVAREALHAADRFSCAVDIVAARRDRYRPLPLRDAGPLDAPQLDEVLVANSRAAANEQVKPAAAAPAVPAAQATPLNERFRTWREKLLDLSLRNKLLNFRLETKSALELDVPDIARFEDLLANDSTFQIHPRTRDARDRRDEKLVRARGGDAARRAALSEDLDRLIVHTPLDEQALARQAVHVKRAAREAIEDGGANVLYLALGLLKWFESDSSTTERFAPLLLMPVAVDYARDTRKVQLRRLVEETLPNWTLVEKVRADFGVELDSLTMIEADESGADVPAMLRAVRERLVRMPRWEVLEEAHIGVFSFTKYLMWRDLGDNQDVLLENRVIRNIANKTTAGFGSTGKSVPPERLDDETTPAELPLVVDADSTQTVAVVAAIRGKSFVLQGPPGTGKSQTITNLIAASLASGKTVLFVSEKMAALEVVYRRLQSVGLGDFCLELHSHKAQKREVIQSLGRTLDRSERTKNASWGDESAELAAMRDKLNAYVRALHEPRALGKTFHEVSARLLALRDAPVLRLSRPRAESMTRDELARALSAAADFGLSATQIEPVATAVFRQCSIESWSAQRERDTLDAIEHACVALDGLEAARNEFCATLEVDPSLPLSTLTELAGLTQTLSAGPLPSEWKNDAEWKRLREQIHAWNDALAAQARRRADLALRWKPELYRAELVELAPLFERWAGAFVLFAWLFLFKARRRLTAMASSALPGNRQIATDLPQARQANEAEQSIEDAQRALRRALEGCGPTDTPADIDTIVERGERLREAVRRADVFGNVNLRRAIALADVGSTHTERAAFAGKAARVLDAISTFQTAAEAVRTLLAVEEGVLVVSDAESLRTARIQLTAWRAHMGDYRPWCHYRSARQALVAAGGSALPDAHAQGRVRGSECERALERALLDAWAVATRDASQVLREFDGNQHHALIARFQAADRGHIRSAKRQVTALLEARLPPSNADAAGEPAILRRELAKKRNHMPLRKLLQTLPNLLPRLKPCLLMSPLSVAQYLPASGRRYDLIVFDEASQICTHDAIGAIGRGNQLIVVGDSKQLPPTAFFARAATDEAAVDENDLTELESILDEASASGMPQQMLGWHYRSRHQDLIEFSNQHYYENRLNIFPAARADVEDLGIKFHFVEGGVYEVGKSRTNPREAQALVDFLAKELRKTTPNKRTFGVVTFSSVQQELIEDLLEEARRKYPEIEPHFADDHPSFEKVFVKNLENVQGDERDEILFSIAYAPDDQGRMLMNFGPINRDGGERRLNVAVTRARKQLRVFSSIRADQIDTNRTRATGARHLKSFLRSAAERNAPDMRRTDERSGDFDSDFERDVYDFLRANGYRVDTQVGCGAYRIDMAVAHPQAEGVYALGIECDGAAYHSGATARDRDRLRQQILEGLGWRLHRIWSTDWNYRRTAEGDRLVRAVEQACQQAVTRSDAPVRAPEPPSAPPAPAATSGPKSPVVAYQRADLERVSRDAEAMYEPAQLATLKRLVTEVLRVEAPIHLDELTRRVGEAYSLKRIGARPRRRIQEVLNLLPEYACRDEFVWPAKFASTIDLPVRERTDRDLELVPVEEIAAAARWVLVQALSIPMADLVRETGRVFGIQRSGAKVEERVRVGVGVLVEKGLCSIDGERVSWGG